MGIKAEGKLRVKHNNVGNVRTTLLYYSIKCTLPPSSSLPLLLPIHSNNSIPLSNKHTHLFLSPVSLYPLLFLSLSLTFQYSGFLVDFCFSAICGFLVLFLASRIFYVSLEDAVITNTHLISKITVKLLFRI